MKHFLWILLFAIIAYMAYSHFINKNYFVLNKTRFSGIDEIDTIEAFPKKGLYILQLIRNGALGHFSMDLGILKQNIKNPKDFTLYEFDNDGKEFRISKDYIAFINTFNFNNWGWFYCKDGLITDNELPFIDKFCDSIRAQRNIFVTYKNGYILLYKNGKLVEHYNYGNLILKDSTRNFDLLKSGLYKLSATDVNLVSNNPDSLFKQQDGIFFIPPPGFGIIKKINKDHVLDYIDSIFSLREFPDKIMFKKN